MEISEKKMQIVIDNYFKLECDVNTSIRNAYEKGFRTGVKKGLAVRPKLEQSMWIPCSERLPEVGRSVLFSRRSMCTREGCLQADGKWWQYWWYELLNADQVTAWKPLPEPYKAESEEL